VPAHLKDEKQPVIGASPVGAADERSAAQVVQKMFDEIAPRYDLLNHVLSMNIDRLWWWKTAGRFRDLLLQPHARVLDLCCGTGDMAAAVRRRSPAAVITGADFSRGMLAKGAAKFTRSRVSAIEADALQLPFAENSFDLVVSAFGFRNLANYDAGLREIYRVLREAGEIGILDFSEPGGVLGKLYGFYFRRVLPRIGTMLSGVSGPYSYLPASVSRFPNPEEMLDRMGNAGFRDQSWEPYSFGIAGLYRARK
jgi:demethylmenaquinone methyltransferase / 2-methoxy-6-polyprenyl-1,4-benzoquinol methylase